MTANSSRPYPGTVKSGGLPSPCSSAMYFAWVVRRSTVVDYTQQTISGGIIHDWPPRKVSRRLRLQVESRTWPTTPEIGPQQYTYAGVPIAVSCLVSVGGALSIDGLSNQFGTSASILNQYCLFEA